MKEKAELIYNNFRIEFIDLYDYQIKRLCVISIENEYKSLREQLFNLYSCKSIESGKIYLHLIDCLIKEENDLKKEVENL